jgi:hypothetical protein
MSSRIRLSAARRIMTGMKTWAVAAVLPLLAVQLAVTPAHAETYPYPLEDIATEMTIPADRFEDWWSKAPEKMKTELRGLPLAKWRPTVLCDYLGFRMGTPEGVECREREYRERMASADQWNPDGSYRGPSEECLARNKTDKWGRLICN